VSWSQFAALGWRIAAGILDKLPQTAAGPDEDLFGSKAIINLRVYV